MTISLTPQLTTLLIDSKRIRRDERAVARSKGTKVEPKTQGPTFQVQAEKFLTQGANRKRKPFRSATLRTYKSQIDTHLTPAMGQLFLQDVGNKALKAVVAYLVDKKLSPGTISLNINLIKDIMASATDEDGEQLFPRKWNSEHIDAPPVEDQKRPTVTPESIQEAISKALPADKVLYAILAGTGLRVAEALALLTGADAGIGNAWVPEESKLIIRCQRAGGTYDETTTGPPKTKAGVREVDLSPELNAYLMANLPQGYTLMFPESEATYRVHLKKNGIQGGFHCFRRFRATHLDGACVPDGLQRFWCGHTSGDVHESYVSSGEKIQLRKEWAIKAGLGFKLETA